MKDLNDLRQERSAAATAMGAAHETLAQLETKDRPDGEDEAKAHDDAITAAQVAFDAAETAFKAADKAVKRAETVEAAQAASARSGDDTAAAPAGGVVMPGGGVQAGVPAQPQNPQDAGADVGLMVAAILNNPRNVQGAVASLERQGHTGIAAALSGATEGAGGVTIPRPQAQTLIGLLTPRITVRRMGVQVHDMPAGELRNARIASGPTASYAAENVAIGDSEPTFDKVEEKFRKLGSLVPVGNSLLRHSSASVGRTVRDLMIQEMGLKADIAFIRYDGSANDPTGLRHWAPGANWQASVANTVAAVEAAIDRAVNAVEEANVMMAAPGWIMRPGTKNFLASLRNPTTGYKVFPSIENLDQLKGYPIFTTTQIPNNLGAGTNETEVYFVDAAEIMIGDSQVITVATSTEAAYVNGSGDTISAFQNDLTLMRAIAEHDLAPAHDAAIAGINGVSWSL